MIRCCAFFLPNVNSSSTNEIEIYKRVRVLSSNLIVLTEIWDLTLLAFFVLNSTRCSLEPRPWQPQRAREQLKRSRRARERKKRPEPKSQAGTAGEEKQIDRVYDEYGTKKKINTSASDALLLMKRVKLRELCSFLSFKYRLVVGSDSPYFCFSFALFVHNKQPQRPKEGGSSCECKLLPRRLFSLRLLLLRSRESLGGVFRVVYRSITKHIYYTR